MRLTHDAVRQPFALQISPVGFAVVTLVGIAGGFGCDTGQQRFETIALVGVGRGDVQFLDIA